MKKSNILAITTTEFQDRLTQYNWLV